MRVAPEISRRYAYIWTTRNLECPPLKKTVIGPLGEDREDPGELPAAASPGMRSTAIRTPNELENTEKESGPNPLRELELEVQLHSPIFLNIYPSRLATIENRRTTSSWTEAP